MSGTLEETRGTLDLQRRAARTLHAAPRGRLRCDCKFLAVGARRFAFRGVTYGTCASRSDGALFPERRRLAADLAMIAAAGFTVVRTYTPPPDDMLELAAANGLRVFAGVFYPDWRYALGCSGAERRRVAREARGEVGLDAGQGAERQAETLDWQLSTAVERGVAGTCVFSWTDEWAVADRPVEGWSFGLTDARRRPRPALEVARSWNRRELADLPH